MARKKYKSDKTTTVLRVSKLRAKEVRKAAARDRETVFVATDKALAAGLAPKTQI